MKFKIKHNHNKLIKIIFKIKIKLHNNKLKVRIFKTCNYLCKF